VTNGLFTVTLDFGAGVFTGASRWLEIGVRTNGGASFTVLSPRQPLTPTPYALYAPSAGTATTAQAVTANAVTGAGIASGQVVKSLNGLRDAVALAAGPNVSFATNANTLTISAAGGGASGGWATTGNAGTTPAANFLGTTDGQPLVINAGSVGINTNDPQELASHAMEDIDAEFVGRVQQGDIVVAEENFGCGSSREHAPVAIKVAGVSVVVAASFARIFYRNAINTGLPIVVCPAAAADAKMGDRLKVDLAAGTVENLTQGKTYDAEAFPPFMQELIDSGGLLPYVKSKIGEGSGS
jgi:3-isopropylmalate/(R)-2-methylmalate dehydratase small subunit